MNQPPVKSFLEFLNTSRLIRYLLLCAFSWAIVQILAYFETVIVVFTFATILAFLLSYPVQWLKQYISHGIAVCLVFFVSLILLIALSITLGLAILSQGQELFRQAPELMQSFLPIVEQIEQWLTKLNLPLDLEAFKTGLEEQISSIIGFFVSFLQGFLANFIDLVFILVVAFFMLLDGKQIWDFVIRLFPPSVQDSLTASLKNNFLGFFRGRLILSIFFAISTLIVCLLLGTPYPLILAAIAGFFDLIPGIGATIGILLVALILIPQGIWLSLQIILYCILLQQVEENMLMPRIMQDSVNLNPVVIFFSLLVGIEIAGLLGLFLAIPITGVIVSLYNLEELKG